MYSIDIDSILPFAIDAFTHIYGEEYHDIISSRIKKFNIMILMALRIILIILKDVNVVSCLMNF